MHPAFHIIALLSTLVAGPVGPKGTPFGAVELQTVSFPDEASCQKALKSSAFSPVAQSLGSFLNSKVVPEYKDNLKADFVCTDKDIKDIQKSLPDFSKQKEDDGGI